jgi:hypothetical protein
MTTKPKTRKAQAAIDPVFAAISEHKALIRESSRLEKSYRGAVDKAEKKYGDRIEHHRRCRSENRSEDDWPGQAITDPFYDRWNSADRAERKAAMRMARTKPTTLAGLAAMIDHIQREVSAGSDNVEDWLPNALKTAAAVADALGRMEAA